MLEVSFSNQTSLVLPNKLFLVRSEVKYINATELDSRKLSGYKCTLQVDCCTKTCIKTLNKWNLLLPLS